MADTVRTVRDRSVQLEKLLSALGGTGKGLGEKTRSLDQKLPDDTKRDLRHVNFLRNAVMHEGKELEPREVVSFDAAVARSLAVLQNMNGRTTAAVPVNRAASQSDSVGPIRMVLFLTSFLLWIFSVLFTVFFVCAFVYLLFHPFWQPPVHWRPTMAVISPFLMFCIKIKWWIIGYSFAGGWIANLIRWF